MTRHRTECWISSRIFIVSTALAMVAICGLAKAPAPILAYDFTQVAEGIVKDAGTSGLDLRCEKLRDGSLPGDGSAVPIVPEAAARFLAEKNPEEFSAAFWIRFDKFPSVGTPFGLFDVSADKAGLLTVRLLAPEDEIIGDYVMTTTTALKKGEWHHVEFTYSLVQWRAALYLDGRFQWENDNLHLPSLTFGKALFSQGFRGAVRDVRLYDMALPIEELAIAGTVKQECGALKERSATARRLTTNAHLRSWLAELGQKADRLAAREGLTTVGELKALKRDVANCEKLVTDIPKTTPGRIVATPVTVYTVNPFSQELYLPYALPEDGKISGQMKLAAARGEYESGSALVVAFKPVTIRKVTVYPLKGPNGKVIPVENVDVKLIKRWFRSGGAWLSYHSDRRQRNLTPDLLVNDDDLIRVDEWRRRNYLRLDYPEGTRYVDVSDPAKGHIGWKNDIPFRDAETLQPVKIGEAGRNQQFYVTVKVPGDAPAGLYKGSLSFDGTDAWIELIVRVLPFDLPTEPAPYGDIDRTYISHLNSMPNPVGVTAKARRDYIARSLEVLRAHNAFHTTSIWDSKTLVEMALKAGFVQDKIFGAGAGYSRGSGIKHDWFSLYPGIPVDKLTTADKKEGLRIAYASARPWQEFFKENFPETAEPYVLFFSESGAYPTLSTAQAERAEVAHKLGQKVFAHGWNNNLAYAGDIQDMHSVVGINAAHAKGWHSAGGETINYSDPFPGQENPVWFRRKIGMDMYKTGYDGEMLHGFLNSRVPWNEFSSDPGGDGNYRNFCMAYPQQDGFIPKLALEGYREAFDDLRYATRLRQLALANRDSKDNDLRRESRRQLLWLENLDGKTADLGMARLAITDRICILQKMIETRKGVLPPADKVAKR